MARDGREAELRIVYKQMDTEKKQKMELLAVSLLNTQMILGNDKLAEEGKEKKDVIDLTKREQEIFAQLLKGVSPKEIGYNLKVSYHTVLFHMKNLYRKLGIQSRAELFAKYSSL